MNPLDDEIRRAAIRQRSAELLESSALALQEAQMRERPRQLWEPQHREPPPAPAPIQRAAQQQQQPAPATMSDAWAAWVDKRLDRRLDPLATEIGSMIGQAERRIREIEDRLAASESATVDLYLELERTVKELQSRAVLKPTELRVVGADHDAA